jgi:hypothetical protein
MCQTFDEIERKFLRFLCALLAIDLKGSMGDALSSKFLLGKTS